MPLQCLTKQTENTFITFLALLRDSRLQDFHESQTMEHNYTGPTRLNMFLYLVVFSASTSRLKRDGLKTVPLQSLSMCLRLLIQGHPGKATLSSAQPIDLYALSFFRMTSGIDKASGLAAVAIDPPSFPIEYTQF